MAISRRSLAFLTAAAIGLGGCIQMQSTEQAMSNVGFTAAARANRGENVDPRKELADGLVRLGIAEIAAKERAERVFWLAYLHGVNNGGSYRMGGEFGGAN